MAIDMRRFIARFVDEARDHLRRLEEGLSALQANPSDPETINTVFRSAHTIKGSAGMLKLNSIKETAHKVENVLGALRDGSLSYSPHLGSLLRNGLDAVASQVEQLAEGKEPAPADEALCAQLTGALPNPEQRHDGTAASTAEKPAVSESTNAREPQPVANRATPEVSAVPTKKLDTVRVSLSKLDELVKLLGEVVSSHGRLRQRVAEIRCLERKASLHGSDGGLALHEFAASLKEDVLAQELQMGELHRKALVMRMLPLATVFDAAPRTVRELARSLGKEVECVVSGAEIELDRQLLDRLGDPIVHLLRNAVDHGIEEPDARLRAGKNRCGRVRIAARQEGSGIAIEVSDDGAGIPLDAIRKKAVHKGLIPPERAAALPTAETLDLIWLPGFSTNAIITDVSGRGVGMDVVKRCIVDELQGTISVDTRPSEGTTFSLRLPPSLAVMRIIQVAAGGEVLGFAAQQVCEFLRVGQDQVRTVAERRAVVIQNEFVSVVSLAELLSLPQAPETPGKDVLLLVLQVRNDKLALQVDDLLDERDMVIKPLPEHLAKRTLVSGMVMSGNNRLAGVLNAPALFDMARKVRGSSHKESSATAAPVRVLVVDDSLNTREIERDVLEAHGYEVTLADDGQDGLRKALSGSFDAVLTDVEMPNMDGFTMTERLRQDERYRGIPIIIITSRQKEEDKRRGIQVGADAYIVKGDFAQGSLIDTLRSLLG